MSNNKPPAAWLVSPVPLHATRRRLRKPRPPAPPVALKTLGRHGRYELQLARVRGKRTLVYVPQP